MCSPLSSQLTFAKAIFKWFQDRNVKKTARTIYRSSRHLSLQDIMIQLHGKEIKALASELAGGSTHSADYLPFYQAAIKKVKAIHKVQDKDLMKERDRQMAEGLPAATRKEYGCLLLSACCCSAQLTHSPRNCKKKLKKYLHQVAKTLWYEFGAIFSGAVAYQTNNDDLIDCDPSVAFLHVVIGIY